MMNPSPGGEGRRNSSTSPTASISKILKDCFSPDLDSFNSYLTNTDAAASVIPVVSPPSRNNLQEEREQALRDYKVTIEYKHLKSHAPGGVYVVPSMDDLRNFYGIIFVRRGPYTNGIFKFQLRLPKKYNDHNQWPQITFSSYVYNPYVDPTSGELGEYA